jgi:two-component system cell cycle sensor histidine kinase/response regulator CckA
MTSPHRLFAAPHVIAKGDDGRLPEMRETIGSCIMNSHFIVEKLKRELERLEKENKSLQMMAQRYRTIFNDSEDAYYELDLEGNFTYFNDKACHILGYSRSELMGMNNRSYTTEKTAQTMYAIFTGVYKTGKPAHVNDYEVIRKDGKTIIAEVSVSPMRNPDGTIIGFTGIARDKTERRKAEILIKESEQRLSDIINFLPDATLAIDNDGTVIAWNRAIEEMTGVKAEHIIGKGNFEYALPFYGIRRPILVDMVLRESDDIEKDYHVLRREKDVLIIETDVPKVKGKPAFLWAKASPIYDRNGTIVGAIESIRDISELKRSEKALRESEAKYRELVQNANSFILRRDTEGKITFFNEFAQKFFGYTEEEIIGKNVIGTIIPERESTGRDLASMIRNSFRNPDGYVTNENENVCRNGKRVWVSWTNKPIRDNTGTIREFLCIGTDITERKKSEEALSVEKAYFEQLFESAPEAIVIADNDGRFLRVNSEFTRMFGYTREEAIGQLVDELIAPEELFEQALSLTRDVTSGNLVSVETIRLRKDRSPVHVSVLGTPIEVEKGQVAVYGIYRDISDRKNLEAQLQQAQKMEAVGTLAGGIAHDFNNLLMGIQGRTSLMLMDIDRSHPHYHHLRQQEEIIKSGADLTRQLLGFARGGKYEVKPANINDVVDKSSEMFGRTKKEITIHKSYEENIGIVDIDRAQMEQVFVNIFINAWQAMPGGGNVYIETNNVTVTEKMAMGYGVTPGEYVMISITDTGVGMDEATRKRIFEPFFTTKDMGRGTGLGLASVYGIIKNHDGFIDVKSEKGRGATFNVYLPAVQAEIAEETALQRNEIIKGTETVLLVDDEEMILEVGAAILEKLGYAVVLAKNGKEAVDLIRDDPNRFDLVILDMIMPEMGGSDALPIINSIKPDAKVLLSSGYSLHSTTQETLKEGCSGFIQKPFSIEELSVKIRELLADGSSSHHR